MKNMFYTATVLCLMAITASAFAGNHNKQNKEEKPQTCLEIFGIALDENNEPINGVHVTLYRQNEEQELAEVTAVDYHDHAFSFKLDANEHYTIEVTKEGYVTRTVSISTMLPASVSLKDIFHYEFELQMFKTNGSLYDAYYLDFPVALISYDAQHDVFDNHDTYTKRIKTKIKTPAMASTVTE